LSIESRQSSVISIQEKTLLENETVSLRLSVCDENGCAKVTLDCGGSTPPLNNAEDNDKGGVEPPQSKALRAFSSTVAGRRRMGIRGEDAAKFNPKSKIPNY